MLDINLIRTNPEKVKAGIAKKGVPPKVLDDFLRLDERWRAVVAALDEFRARQNVLSDKIARERGEALIAEAKELKGKIAVKEEEKRVLEDERTAAIHGLPNLPFDDVPAGKDERENKVVRKVGKKRDFQKEGFDPKDYLTLAEALGIIDVKKSAEVSGSRFGYLLGGAARLEFALVQFAFETLSKKGFVPAVPPVMIRPEVYQGMGRLAGDQKDERYYLPADDLYLVGSSEHTMGPIHMNDALEEETLPRRYVAFSTCFRREAGSYGKDTKGILRVHQFDKVEMFSFTAPEKSEAEHRFLLSVQEELVGALGLPYQVVEICTGDMGFTDARQFDIETWLPGQTMTTTSDDNGSRKGVYRETNSCSNTTNFQARGINARVRRKDGRIEHLHMLNATGFAVGRILIAIIENYQRKDGTIEVPKVLRGYVGEKVIR